jgi:hypothetical protein
MPCAVGTLDRSPERQGGDSSRPGPELSGSPRLSLHNAGTTLHRVQEHILQNINMQRGKQIIATTLTSRLKLVAYTLEKILIVLAPLLKVDRKDVLKSWNAYSSVFDKHLRHRGKHDTARIYKELFQMAVNISVGLSVTPLRFTKSNKEGVPRQLFPVLHLLRGGTNEKRLGLTICRIYTLIRLKPDLNVDAIVKPSNSEVSETLLDTFNSFIKGIIKPRDAPEATFDFNFGARSGPNGPAVISAHYDAHGLKLHGLYDAWKVLANATYSPLRGSLESCLRWVLPEGIQPKVGKVAFISEKGGKTRPVAMVDFWSQQVLKTFHQDIVKQMIKLMGVTDSTMDQSTAFKRAMSESRGKKTFSYDLKSATDRFPFKLQKAVFQSFYGKKFADSWEILMLRPFYVSELKSEIKWARGQPLGSYSSWPIFTLTHHLIIRFAAKDHSFSEYQVLGDDVIIWNEKVATAYKDLLTELDVEISLGKSLVSLDINHTFGEFAKRIFLNGEEISPISPYVLEQCSSLYGWPNLLEHVCERWGLPDRLSELLALEIFPAKGRRLLSILLGSRKLMKAQMDFPWCALGYDRIAALLEGVVDILSNRLVASLFGRKPKTRIPYDVSRGRNPYATKDLIKAFNQVGLAVSDSLLTVSHDEEDPHPLILMLAHQEKLRRASHGFSENLTSSLHGAFLESDDGSVPIDDQISLVKGSKVLMVPNLDIFFYNTTDRARPKVIIDIFYTLISKKNRG